MELLLGCGNFRQKRLYFQDKPEWDHLVTLDIDPSCSPDVVWDLNQRPLPFESHTFDELHVYDVLEHLGTQGDWRGFFEEFTEYHRLLKPNGLMFIIVPHWSNVWAFADPGHTRVLPAEIFTFLDQDNYTDVGQSAKTDYRGIWKHSFKLIHCEQTTGHTNIILKAIDASTEIQDTICRNDFQE